MAAHPGRTHAFVLKFDGRELCMRTYGENTAHNLRPGKQADSETKKQAKLIYPAVHFARVGDMWCI